MLETVTGQTASHTGHGQGGGLMEQGRGDLRVGCEVMEMGIGPKNNSRRTRIFVRFLWFGFKRDSEDASIYFFSYFVSTIDKRTFTRFRSVPLVRLWKKLRRRIYLFYLLLCLDDREKYFPFNTLPFLAGGLWYGKYSVPKDDGSMLNSVKLCITTYLMSHVAFPGHTLAWIRNPVWRSMQMMWSLILLLRRVIKS